MRGITKEGEEKVQLNWQQRVSTVGREREHLAPAMCQWRGRYTDKIAVTVVLHRRDGCLVNRLLVTPSQSTVSCISRQQWVGRTLQATACCTDGYNQLVIDRTTAAHVSRTRSARRQQPILQWVKWPWIFNNSVTGISGNKSMSVVNIKYLFTYSTFTWWL